MKALIVALIFFSISVPSFGYISGIAIQTESRANMQVFINGKLYNKNPVSFLRVKSQPGLFHVEVKVLNPYNKRWYLVRKNIRVEKGMEFYYRVVFKKGLPPELKEIRRYPVYSKYFLQPSLYNHHPVS